MLLAMTETVVVLAGLAIGVAIITLLPGMVREWLVLIEELRGVRK